MTPDTRPQLSPLYDALSEALSAAGQPRLAAWARLRHVLASPDPLPDLDELVDLAAEARADHPPDAEVLYHTLSRADSVDVTVITNDFWQIPDGPPRDAVIAALEPINRLAGRTLPPPFMPPEAELLLAVERLEQGLFAADQLRGVAACVLFRRMIRRRWTRDWALGPYFEFWLALAGPPARCWDWLCLADPTGLVDHIRGCLTDLAEGRGPLDVALETVLSAAGLPAHAAGEARHQARRAALHELAQAASTPRARELILATQTAMGGDPWAAHLSLRAGRTARRVQNMADRAHVEVCDLPWLAARLKPCVRGREGRAALSALERLA